MNNKDKYSHIQKEINLATSYIIISVLKNWIRVYEEYKVDNQLSFIQSVDSSKILDEIQYNFDIKIRSLLYDVSQYTHKRPEDMESFLKETLENMQEGLQ